MSLPPSPDAAESDARSGLSPPPSHRHTRRHNKRRSPPPPQQQVSEGEEEEGCGRLDDGNVRNPHRRPMGSHGKAGLKCFRHLDPRSQTKNKISYQPFEIDVQNRALVPCRPRSPSAREAPTGGAASVEGGGEGVDAERRREDAGEHGGIHHRIVDDP